MQQETELAREASAPAYGKLEGKIHQDKRAVGEHYDQSPAFFATFLGPWMAYSCAYFTDENNTLERAEEDKLELIARKLELKKGECVLDIGCGWGSFLFYSAEIFGSQSVGITLSGNQANFVNALAQEKGLDDRLRADVLHVYEMDYPDQSFDKIVSVGAIEHIEDLDFVFEQCARLLKEDGLLLIHGMTQPWKSRAGTIAGVRSEVDDLVEEHFGVGHWHSLSELIEALEKSGFEILDHENITQHYTLTVERWLERLIAAEEEIVGSGLLTDEKYREFIAFFAGYIYSFEMSNTLCNQIVCQKITPGESRPLRTLTRERMLLASESR